MVASMFCCDAAQIVKTMLAGTATHCLTDVVEASFGGEEPKDIQEDYEEAEEEEAKLPSKTPMAEPGRTFERLILFTVDNNRKFWRRLRSSTIHRVMGKGQPFLV